MSTFVGSNEKQALGVEEKATFKLGVALGEIQQDLSAADAFGSVERSLFAY